MIRRKFYQGGGEVSIYPPKVVRERKMTSELIREVIASFGWERDRWGSYRKEEQRIKFTKTTVRLDRKGLGGVWVTKRSAYIKQMGLGEDGGLRWPEKVRIGREN